MAVETADLIVVGSGQGGVPLAVDYAKAGKRVVLFERGKLGGTCVNVGCTPSKALLAAAHQAGRARRASDVGVFADVRVSSRDALARTRKIRDEWHDGVEEKVAASGIDLVRAEAAFTGPRTLAGGGREVTAPVVVLDTGGSPVAPPIPGLADGPYLTSDTFFEQEALPERLVVIGAGYIGLELGQGAQRLGSSVTVVHQRERVMEREEHDASDAVRKSMERDGVAFRFNAMVRGVAHDGGVHRIRFGDGSTLEADGILVATGRMPNTAALRVHLGGVECRTGGFIVVDDYLRTTAEGVYAIGDAAGQPAFTHVSWEDYRRVKATIEGNPRRADDRVLSYSTFTEPQLARTGMTLAEARAKNIPAKAVTLATADIARGYEWGLSEGFYRLVVDESTGKIIGATLVGYEAGEIVHVLALAIHLGATWRDLDAFMGIHPTFCEGLPSLARLLEAKY